MKKFGIICGIVAFAVCLAAGLWILCRTGLTFSSAANDDDFVWEAIGLYFIGKAFFVGPMLIIASLKERI